MFKLLAFQNGCSSESDQDDTNKGILPNHKKQSVRPRGRSESVSTAPEAHYRKRSPVESLDLPAELETPFSQNLARVSSEKVCDIFSENLRSVLADPGLPGFIKKLLIEKMPEMDVLLGRMASRASAPLLLDREGQDLFPRYKRVAQQLKKDLITDKDPAGITFSGRSLKLFVWCREELEETAHPEVGYCREYISTLFPDDLHAFNEKFATLWDILNQLILQIAYGDDIGDSIQDKTLTDIFADIPFATQENSQEYREFLSSYRRGIFEDYFNEAVTVWEDALHKFETFFGEENFRTQVKPAFLDTYRAIMRSLTYSQHMNMEPHDEDITLETVNTTLAPNMMVECFRLMEKCCVNQFFSSKYGITLGDSQVFDNIILASQRSASSANGGATVTREWRENDVSNPIFVSLNNFFNQALEEKKENFEDVFEKFLVENGYINHFFSHYYEDAIPEKLDWLSLSVLRKEACTQIMEYLIRMSQRGVLIPDSDYSSNSLAEHTLKIAKQSSDERLLNGGVLLKLKRHIQLIDDFTEKLLAETPVQHSFFSAWASDIQSMKTQSEHFSDPLLAKKTLEYVNSWEVFLCTRLLLNYSF